MCIGKPRDSEFASRCGRLDPWVYPLPDCKQEHKLGADKPLQGVNAARPNALGELCFWGKHF